LDQKPFLYLIFYATPQKRGYNDIPFQPAIHCRLRRLLGSSRGLQVYSLVLPKSNHHSLMSHHYPQTSQHCSPKIICIELKNSQHSLKNMGRERKKNTDVPNYMKLVSWCRLRREHNWFEETLGGWELGMGREWGGGGQFISNLGPGWKRIAPRKEEGFQVSRRDSGERGVVRGS
jgi:hypothetical protein